MKAPAKKRSFFANAMKLFGDTLTKAGDGIKRYSGSFTPVAGPKPGDLLAPWQKNGERAMDTTLYPTSGPTAATLPAVGEVLREPMKLESDITPQRVQQFLLSRFNPIKGLSPRLMSSYLDQWDYGFVRYMALVWSKIKERDDQVAAVTESREVKPADMDWEIVASDETPEAAQHKMALEDFYRGLSVTHALDLNQRGSVQLLLKMMMKAVGDKFAAFEIVWRPEPEALTAELKYVPLWFFENRTGQLRFLPYELAIQGVPLEPGGWLVHVGKGLFAATAIVYLYKQMGLKTWVTYQEKFGLPFLHAKTNADYNSEEWNGLVTAIQNFSSDGGLVTKTQTQLEAFSAGSSGEMPHEPFCDRMDRAIARIWRGGDLSSMSKGGGASSKGGGVGSLPQMENESALAKTDAEQLSESCQFYLDRWVIKYRFGDDVAPKAKFVIQPPQEMDTTREIAVDQFLLSAGVPLAVSDLIERYGRNLPDEGDALAHAPAARSSFAGDGSDVPADGTAPLGNVAPNAPGMRRYVRTAGQLQAAAMAKAMAPLRARLKEVAAIEDPARRKVELAAIKKSLPGYVGRSVSHELVNVISDSLATATVIGATDGAESTGHVHSRPRFPTNGHATHHR